MDGRPAGQKAECLFSGPPWHCFLSTCWPWPRCSSSSPSNRPLHHTLWPQMDVTDTHAPSGLQSAQNHHTWQNKWHQTCIKCIFFFQWLPKQDASQRMYITLRCLHECVLVFLDFLTWHQSRVCGALDNPQWVRLASLRCQSPYGSSSCLLHSWTQLLFWASWHPSLSRRGSCRKMDTSLLKREGVS